MFSYLFSWILLALYLSPILLAGILIANKVTSINRFELLFPVGSVLGLAIFTFLINILSFIEPGRPAIIFAYFLVIFLIVFLYKMNHSSEKIVYPKGRILLYYLVSLIGWLVFIFWKGNNALIGSDTNLYYAIANTFLKGNFLPMTPWQPDIPLSYHLGSLQLLSAFYLFTNLSFEFLHIFFSCFFVFICSQIIVWFFTKYETVYSYVFGNITAGVVLISFGFFKAILINFPLHLPQINSIKDLFFWIRDLPTVNQSIEVYGAPINLDALIYFIFHSYGLALALCLILLVIYRKLNEVWLNIVVLIVGICSMALINESIFIFLAPVLVIGYILLDIENKSLAKNVKKMIIAFFITILLILLQGGIITNHIFQKTNLEDSILLFPDKNEVQEDFIKYHYNQEISKVLELKQEWQPFRWISMGVDVLLLISIVTLVFIKTTKERIVILMFFLSGLFSLLAYNFVVPKFLIANGNRLLAFSFIFTSLSMLFSIQLIFNRISQKFFRNLLLTILCVIIFIPTIIPPLFLLSKNRFSDNKLVPRSEQKTEGISWVEKNISFKERFIVLDIRTPHPSGQARIMFQSGVFGPTFPSEYKAYTIEASPEYFDVAYYLNPSALKKLSINYILIEKSFFESMSEKRKQDLANENYFQKVFDNSEKIKNWEKIYLITDKYLAEGEELEGSFNEYSNLFPVDKKIYIDNEENFNPSYLRRALIFSIRNRSLFYLPQSGVYLNVEANIKKNHPSEDSEYDYLVLGNKADPEKICGCKTKNIWKGFKNEVYVWQRI